MADLLKKVLGSVLPRPVPGSTSRPPERHHASVFDRVPHDVFVQILALVGPKDAARAAAVCRLWRVAVADNMLWVLFLRNGREAWDEVAFAETHLRAGLPSMMCLDPRHQLSFMSIYGQREKVPGSIIIDGGSGYCKYGWSKYVAPSGRCATFLEFGNIESPMYSRLRKFFATIYKRMQVKPASQPIILSVPICHSDDTESARESRRQLKDAIYSALFDMNVPAVCAIDQAVLALYAARRTSGIVVNIGFHVTSVVPILLGKVMHDIGVEIVGQGALKLTGFLREQMQRRNISFESLYTVRTLKENLCHVAFDYEAELHKDTQASMEVAGEGWFTLSQERFRTGEILFQPQIGGLRAMGLHGAVGLCIDHCNDAVNGDNSWFKTVVLAGGTACMPGLPERLEKELVKLLPASLSDGIKVIPPAYGSDSAWFGAKTVANVSTFTDTWCITKKQFRQKYRRNTSLVGSW